MSLAYITTNAHSDYVQSANVYPNVFIDQNCFTTVMDTTDGGVKDLLQDINSHKFSEIMTIKPYISAYYDGTNINVTLINPPTILPTTAKFSILDTVYQVNITSNTFTFPISIHSSVATQRIQVSIILDGFPYCLMELGSSFGNTPIQLYVDSNNTYHIVPLNATDLASYWTNKFVNMAWSQADLTTVTGLLMHTVFNYILPNMINSNYTPLVLTSEQQNGLNDIQINILPDILSVLDNIKPDINTTEMHYASYSYHLQEAKQAMESYVKDKDEITKYTTLK